MGSQIREAAATGAYVSPISAKAHYACGFPRGRAFAACLPPTNFTSVIRTYVCIHEPYSGIARRCRNCACYDPGRTWPQWVNLKRADWAFGTRAVRAQDLSANSVSLPPVHRSLDGALSQALLRVALRILSGILLSSIMFHGPGISEQQAADTMYALATDESVYVRLTGECHWTPGRYADLTRQHPDSHPRGPRDCGGGMAGAPRGSAPTTPTPNRGRYGVHRYVEWPRSEVV